MTSKPSPANVAYPALFEPEQEGGFTVTFPEAGIAATHGASWEEALAQAEDMLDEAVLGMIAHRENVPCPVAISPRNRMRPVVNLPPQTAAKLEIYRAMRAAGLSEEQLAAKLGWPATQVMRLLDGRRPARLDHIEAALRALGRRLVVASEAASGSLSASVDREMVRSARRAAILPLSNRRCRSLR